MSGRVEDDVPLTLGQVVTDREGVRWVFIGWARTTAGRTATFARELVDQRINVPIWTATVVGTETLLARFPSLQA